MMEKRTTDAAMQTAQAQLAQAGFTVLDLTLYLDTHPDDPGALSYFSDAKARYQEAKANYQQQVGPVRVGDVDSSSGWSWVETPWPWEV